MANQPASDGKVKITYIAKQLSSQERWLERDLLEHQSRGWFPVYHKGNVWIFETVHLPQLETGGEATNQDGATRSTLESAPTL